jgi:intein/homing endonuclease
MTLTIRQNGRTDSPREISVDEALEKIREMNFPRGRLFERKLDLAVNQMGSFDPRSGEYIAFERKAKEKRRQVLRGEVEPPNA